MPQPATSAETTEASGQAPAMGARQPEATPPAGTVVSDVAKAKGDPQLVVYDESGNLLGIVDPGDLTPVANAGAAEPDGDGGVQAPDDAPAAAAPPTDLTPAPPAEVGTPAEDVTDDTAAMTKTTPETTLGESTSDGLLKAALQDFGAQQAQVLKAALQELDQRREAQIDELTKDTGERISALTKQVEQYAERNSALQETVAKQAAQITALENAPATREVVRNGQLPPDHLLRGQQYGAAASAIDIAKAQQRRAALYAASTAAEQNQIAREMNADAITALQAIHAGQ